jgi:alkanesulfonate monooxygenase SsuD/methylene tetrahydromethanopterin reductase-like flavin-dependent oxidoreductase (luciferase family)
MKIGALLPLNDLDGPAGSRWPTIREVALTADQGGLDSVWAYDHLLFRSPGEDEAGPHEPLAILAAVAAITTRVELGTIVLGTGFRSPAITAKAAVAVDEVSDGRFILGLGAGWHEPEYAAFGYPFDHRVGRFEEFLAVTLPLVRGERVTFHGRWHDAADAVALPPPPRPARLPGRMPVLIAAKGERMLRLAARHADAWNAAWFGFPVERFHQRRAQLVEACEAEGRDPASIELTAGLVIDAEAADEGRPVPGDALPPEVDTVARALDAWRDLGVGHVQVDLRPNGPRLAELLATAAAKHRGE